MPTLPSFPSLPTVTSTTARGEQGVAGPAGPSGDDGVDAFSLVTTISAMPALGATVTLAVDQNAWCAIGQHVFLGTLSTAIGYFQITSISNTGLAVTLLNLEDGTGVYADNVAAGTAIPVNTRIVPCGPQGLPGATVDTSQFLATYGQLNDIPVADRSYARTNLGVPGLPVSVAEGGTGATSAATARTNLGLAIGTNVQAYATILQNISNVLVNGAGTGYILFNDSTDQVEVYSNYAWSRDMLDVASMRLAMAYNQIQDNVIARGTIDATTTANQPLYSPYLGSIIYPNYIIRRIVLANLSGNPETTLVGCISTDQGASGNVVAGSSSFAVDDYSFVDLTLQSGLSANIIQDSALYFKASVTGSAPALELIVYGDVISWPSP